MTVRWFEDPKAQEAYEAARKDHERIYAAMSREGSAYRRGYDTPDLAWDHRKPRSLYPYWAAGKDNRIDGPPA